MPQDNSNTLSAPKNSVSGRDSDHVVIMKETISYAFENGIPVTFTRCGEKGHFQKEWQKKLVTNWSEVPSDEELLNYNVALVTKSEDPSRLLVDLDIDDPEILTLLPFSSFPDTASWGRKNKPRSHLLISVTGGSIRTGQRQRNAFDIRSGVKLVQAPPSTHPSGDQYTWHDKRAPTVVSAAKFDAMVNELEAMVILSRLDVLRKQGERDNTYLGLAGMMAAGGMQREDAVRIVRGIATAANDEERAHRVGVVERTYDRFSRGEPVVGVSELKDHLDESIIAELRYLLGLKIDARSIKLDLGLSELGNADRFVLEYRDKVRYSDEFGWLVYDGKRWLVGAKHLAVKLMIELTRRLADEAMAQPNKELREALLSWALASQSNAKIQASLSLAQFQLYVRADQFDLDPMLLNVDNGTLDLRTRELRPHDPADMITKLAPAEYDPDIRSPALEKVFLDAADGNAQLVDYEQRAFGYSITGLMTEDVVHILYGPGSNAKTVKLEIVRQALGDYAAAIRPDSIGVTGSTASNDIARLHGVRLVTTVETEDGRRLNESLLKQLTGDTLTVRFLYKEYFEFRPVMKLFIATNHQPIVRGNDAGIWRRLRMIGYDVSFVEEHEKQLYTGVRKLKTKDKTINEQLEQELQGVLNWLVEGCQMYLEHGLDPVPEVQTATNQFRSDQDVILRFLEEETVNDEAARQPAGELYQRYRQWAKDSGEEPVSSTKFGRRLTELGFSVDRSVNPKVRLGLRLRDFEFTLHPLRSSEEVKVEKQPPAANGDN